MFKRALFFTVWAFLSAGAAFAVPTGTGGQSLPLGTDAGDDLDVGTGKFTVEGDTGRAGVNDSSPDAKFDVTVGASDNVGGVVIDQADTDQLALEVNASNTTADVVDLDGSALISGNLLQATVTNALATDTALFNVTGTALDTATLIKMFELSTTAANDVDIALVHLERGASDARIVFDEGTDTWMLDQGAGAGLVAIATGAAGGTAWDAIGDPAGNGAVNMGTTTQTLDWTLTGNASNFAFTFNNNGGSAGTDTAVTISNAVSTNAATDLNTETLLLLDQADTTAAGTTAVDAALLITNSGGSTLSTAIRIGSGTQTIATGIDVASTGVTTDLSLQNAETIDNNTDDAVTLTGAGGTNNESFTINLDSAAASGATLSSGNTFVLVNDNLSVGINGNTTENISAAGFAFSGNDLYVDDKLGVNGEAYFDADVTIAAGTAIAGTAPLTFTAGTNLTTAEDGAVEMDADCFYGTTDAGNRGYIPAKHIIRADATRTFTSNTTQQAIFNSPANGTLTLETGAYLFECLVQVTATSATSGNVKLSLNSGGTATLGSILYVTTGIDAANNTITAHSGVSEITSTVSATNTVTASTATVTTIHMRGTFEVTVAGTIIPSMAQTTAAAAVVTAGSYFTCERVGSTTVTNVGQWT